MDKATVFTKTAKGITQVNQKSASLSKDLMKVLKLIDGKSNFGQLLEKAELDKHYVFRLNPETKELKVVAEDFEMPNGLCFSPDEKKLYIADSGAAHHIRAFDVKDDRTLGGGAVFCVVDQGVPDGIRSQSTCTAVVGHSAARPRFESTACSLPKRVI